jgi:spermidine synthase
METIHSTEYNGMPIEVVETQQTVYLQFDGGLKQSSFKKKNPKELQKPYSKHMVKVLDLWNLDHDSDPKDILVLGLGGGIIPTWLYDNTNANIDVVEIVPELKEISETYFNMPVDDRLNIIIEDCNEYMPKCDKKYDIIFVDVYGAISSVIDDANTFHTGIKRVMKEQGMAAINSLVTERNYDTYMKVLNNNYSTIIEEYVKLGRYSNNHISFCA